MRIMIRDLSNQPVQSSDRSFRLSKLTGEFPAFFIMTTIVQFLLGDGAYAASSLMRRDR